MEPNYTRLDRTQKSKHDLVELLVRILDILRINNDLSTSDVALAVYNHNTASRLTMYMIKLHSNGLVTRKNLLSIKNTPSTYWSITPKGRILLEKYKKLMEIFPNQLKGSGVHNKTIWVYE